MIDDLIKRCQENDGCRDCHNCEYNTNNSNDEIFCLIELVNIFNIKYGTNYAINDYDVLTKIKEILDEC